MKRVILVAALLCGTAWATPNWIPVTATKIQSGKAISGTPVLLAGGRICFLGTDANDKPINFSAGGGGMVITKAACFTVTNGVIQSGAQIPNPDHTLPQGISYHITVTTAAGELVVDLPKVTITGTTFDFDAYVPVVGAISSPHTNAIVGNTGITGDLAVSGAITGGSIPSLPIAQSDVTGLVSALAGKAATSHTHAEADVTSLTADLAAKEATANKNATNGYAGLSSGKIAASQLPDPGASAHGGINSKTCTGTDKVSAIGTDGIPVCSTDQTTAGGAYATVQEEGAAQTQRTILDFVGPAVTATDDGPGTRTKVTVVASGTGACPANQFARTLNDGAGPTCGAVGSADITDGVVTGTDLASGTVATSNVVAALKTRTAIFILGADDGSVLVDTNDQKDIFINQLGSGVHITKVGCYTDAGNSIINLQRNDGSPANILSSNLTCSSSGANTTTFVSGEDAIADTYRVDFVLVTAASSGTPKRITVVITYTLD